MKSAVKTSARTAPACARNRSAVDLVWVLAGPETYERLVLDQGSPPEGFEAWLNDTLVLLLAEG